MSLAIPDLPSYDGVRPASGVLAKGRIPSVMTTHQGPVLTNSVASANPFSSLGPDYLG